MFKQLKTKLYSILADDLGYTVFDTTAKKGTACPWIRISTVGALRVPYKLNDFQYIVDFRIEIFSDYNGESQILDMEKEIYEKMSKMYEITGVSHVSGSTVKIIDDKTTGVIKKHGIISYQITCAGEEIENE